MTGKELNKNQGDERKQTAMNGKWEVVCYNACCHQIMSSLLQNAEPEKPEKAFVKSPRCLQCILGISKSKIYKSRANTLS